MHGIVFGLSSLVPAQGHPPPSAPPLHIARAGTQLDQHTAGVTRIFAVDARAVALLPADTAAEYLVQAGGLQPLAPLFCESHAVLGSVVRLERCADCVRLKSAYAALNKEFQIARKEHNDATSTAAAGGGGGQPQQQQAKPPQHTRFAFGSAGTAAAAAAAAASTAASAGSSTVTEEDVADIKARANAASDALR